MNSNKNNKKMNLSLAVLVMLTISMSTSMKTEATSEVHDKLVIEESYTTYLRNREISQRMNIHAGLWLEKETRNVFHPVKYMNILYSNIKTIKTSFFKTATRVKQFLKEMK